jgi:hypothetical protein
MGLGAILGKAAVRELLKLSPQILEAAQQAASRIRSGRRRDGDEGLEGRLARLEAEQEEQGALAESLATQLRLTSTALEELRQRLRIALAVATVSVIAAVAAFITAVLR